MQSISVSQSARVLVFPHQFFRDTRPDPNDAGPIVLAVAAVHLVSHYLILLGGAMIVSLQQSDAGVVDLLADIWPWMYLAAPILAILVVVNWILVSLVLHIAITLQEGSGPFGDTLAVVGWSAPASLLALLVHTLGLWLALWGDPTVMAYDAKLLAVGPALTVASAIGGLMTLLWQAAIWPAGLSRAHDVSGAAAGRATALTILLLSILLLFGLGAG